MTERIHIVLDRAEKEWFRRAAAREGKSLSEWLRDAGRDRARRAGEEWALDDASALQAFFAACDARERGHEPDWHLHRAVIERPIHEGAGQS